MDECESDGGVDMEGASRNGMEVGSSGASRNGVSTDQWPGGNHDYARGALTKENRIWGLGNLPVHF